MKRLLEKYEMVVAVMAVGIIVRSLCRHLQDKWTDRPVVAVDSSLTCAVPVVGGHHGANELALFLASRLGLYAAITTATDASGRPCLENVAKELSSNVVNRESSKLVNLAFLNEDVPVLKLKGPKIVVVDDDVAVLKLKGLVLGIGARKGVSCIEVLQAIDAALNEVGKERDEIGIMATAWLKRDENGLTGSGPIPGKGDGLPLPRGSQLAEHCHALQSPRSRPYRCGRACSPGSGDKTHFSQKSLREGDDCYRRVDLRRLIGITNSPSWGSARARQAFAPGPQQRP